MIRRWARDPLVHFLVAGALLFALFAWRGEEADPESRTIAVNREVQASLALQFEAMMQRPPTDAELDGLIERWLRDEVLYREALRLGLDRDDAVVRRRLAKKMDALASAQAETAQPSEAELREWLAANPERFARGATISFDQLYFAEEAAARSALSRLRDNADWERLGEPLSVPASQERASMRLVTDRYGRQFTAAVEKMEAGDNWQGPVPSGFGWHLVRLQSREQGKIPPLAEIRPRVEDDWRGATMSARTQAAYQVLRDAYRVEIAE